MNSTASRQSRNKVHFLRLYVLRGIIYGINALFFIPLAISGEQKSSAQYSIDLVSLHDKEMLAREQIVQEQSQISQLRRQIAEADQKINKAVNDQYSIFGITKSEIERAEQVLKNLRKKIDELKNIPSTELIKKKDLIHECTTQLLLLESSSVVKFRIFSKTISELNKALLQISSVIETEFSDTATENLNQPEKITTDFQEKKQPKTNFSFDTYTVKNSNETLFIIAGYEQIYGNSHQWYKIYKANKDLINENYQQYKDTAENAKIINPYDLIFPGQILRIPRRD